MLADDARWLQNAAERRTYRASRTFDGKVECVVVGAGVVGLAVARRLALAGREVIVLEAAEDIGTGTSSRNSEVIHAGIYYPAGSLMARFCVAGPALYDYCDEHGVPHRRCGKLIVATTADEAEQARRRSSAHAEANGVDDHAAADRRRGARAGAGAELRRRAAVAVDRHHRQPAYMLALHGDAENAGARASHFMRRCCAAARRDGRFEVDVGGDGADDAALPAAGQLGRARMRRRSPARIDGMPPDRVPTAYLRQGQLFQLRGALAVLAADLSGAGAGRPRRPPDLDLGGQAVRPRRGMGRRRSTTPSIRRGRSGFTRRSGDTGRPAGRRAGAGLFRHPAEDRAAGGRRGRIS